jgi:hypothetical protein
MVFAIREKHYKRESPSRNEQLPLDDSVTPFLAEYEKGLPGGGSLRVWAPVCEARRGQAVLSCLCSPKAFGQCSTRPWQRGWATIWD